MKCYLDVSQYQVPRCMLYLWATTFTLAVKLMTSTLCSLAAVNISSEQGQRRAVLQLRKKHQLSQLEGIFEIIVSVSHSVEESSLLWVVTLSLLECFPWWRYCSLTKHLSPRWTARIIIHRPEIRFPPSSSHLSQFKLLEEHNTSSFLFLFDSSSRVWNSYQGCLILPPWDKQPF